MNNKLLKTVLLIDDDKDSLELYAHLLRERLGAIITCSSHPTAALRLAQKQLLDIVLIDVTINYNGTPFGGFEIYSALSNRYGDSSLVAYSQYITDDLLKQYEYDFNFLEKGNSIVTFVDKICGLATDLRKQQSCFVAMPFGSEHDEIYRVIEKCIEETSYRCVRIDHEHFTSSIIDTIFLEIRRAKIVIFLATGKNPNVFYECGHAVALKKEVIMITDEFGNLPFDVRDRNAISYGSNLDILREKLQERLAKLSAPQIDNP